MGQDGPKQEAPKQGGPNYVAWAMVLMLLITTIEMINSWFAGAMRKEESPQVYVANRRPPLSYTALRVPPPGIPILAAAPGREHDEQTQRANDSTAAELQSKCRKSAGGDISRQYKDGFCKEFHAYVNFGIMPLPPVKIAQNP